MSENWSDEELAEFGRRVAQLGIPAAEAAAAMRKAADESRLSMLEFGRHLAAGARESRLSILEFVRQMAAAARPMK